MRKGNNIEDNLLLYFSIFVFLVVAFGLAYTSYLYIKTSSLIDRYQKEFNGVLHVFMPSSCDGCEDVSNIISNIKKAKNLNLDLIYHDEVNGTFLLEKYNIERLPALILELDDEAFVPGFYNEGNAYIYQTNMYPQYNVSSKSVVGNVRVVVFDAQCDICANVSGIIDIIKSSGVYIGSVEYGDPKEYGAKRIPSFALSQDIEYYPVFGSLLSFLEKSSKEGYYVFNPLPPYIDLETNEVRGKVRLIYVNASSCDGCFDPRVLGIILLRAGMYIENESVVSYDKLDERYKDKIVFLPTAIIEGDLGAYENLVLSLIQVGSFYDDFFVFTNPQVLGLQDGMYVEVKDNG